MTKSLVTTIPNQSNVCPFSKRSIVCIQRASSVAEVAQSAACVQVKIGHLDTKGEFYANIDVAGHFDDLAELDRLLGSLLEIINGEDLEARLVDLFLFVHVSH